MGAIEFAMIGHRKLSLTGGVRAGARAASIGRPVTFVRSQVRAAAGLSITDAQIVVEYNSLQDGSGSWLLATDNASGSANAVPYGRLIRVRVLNWPHRLVTGSFFAWLPGVSNGQLLLQAQMAMRRE